VPISGKLPQKCLGKFNLKGVKSVTSPLAQHFKSKEQEPKFDTDIAYM